VALLAQARLHSICTPRLFV